MPHSQFDTDLSLSFGAANSFSLPIDLSQEGTRPHSSTFCATVETTVSINPVALQKQLDSALKRIAHLSQSLDRAETDNNILESRVDSLSHQLTLAKLKEESLQDEITSLKKSLEEAPPSEITSLQNQLKALQHALNCQSSKHTKYVDNMKSKLANATGLFFSFPNLLYLNIFLEVASKATREAQRYGAVLVCLRSKLRELSPDAHHEIWNKLKHTLTPLLVGRFEMSAMSQDIPLRKQFHNMLLHLPDLPPPLVKAVGSFMSTLLQRVDEELPTTRLVSRLLSNPPPLPPTPPTCSTVDRGQIIDLLNKQHSAIMSTLSALQSCTINWTSLPLTTVKTTLSAQTRNMLDSFLLSVDNRLHDHVFKMKSVLAAAININGSCLSAIKSSGFKSRKEFEALLTSLTREDDQHFALKKQLADLLIDFRITAGIPQLLPPLTPVSTPRAK